MIITGNPLPLLKDDPWYSIGTIVATQTYHHSEIKFSDIIKDLIQSMENDASKMSADGIFGIQVFSWKECNGDKEVVRCVGTAYRLGEKTFVQ